MLTIYVSPRDQKIVTVDGCAMTVKATWVRGARGLVSLQDLEVPADLDDVEFVYTRRFFPKKLHMPEEVKSAILGFLNTYHRKQDTSFDCYAFVNLVKGVETHKVPYMLQYWELRALPWRVRSGTVVFLLSGNDHFHHAAVCLGSGFYLSVWGAGGDLEIATLEGMMRDYHAEYVAVATPI